ncbi:e32f8544-9332-45ef-8532-7678c68d28a2 [Thermothielavioides terrestris]|uniref:HECT-type E3 ubiquitin transferase n=1 Tax=Thermothielavioides terrestris TaxID=2587410 RepID=A0A3S4AQ81_9PEZI|nr:e32f8544-9332-45ef-8532-7678c68d28a2 [Thermothielavioides terrestris]
MRPTSAGGSSRKNDSELDLLAGLWQEARFARLPCDAPRELKDLVEDIDNPKRVYAIHKASRRHNFQLLVQKYIVQLREGCGAEHCNTSTCFTCRKRIAGRAPVRSLGSSAAAGQDSESEDESLLPQALARLDAEVVDFLCDVIQEDGTAEKHMLEPQSVTRFHNRQAGQRSLARRKRRLAQAYPTNMRLEWKLFVEQTLFYVLSDPHLVLRSFTQKGQLYDSQTLWYCMLRLTRIAPSLVFHSLWMAAASLFAPPKPLQTLRSPTTKVFPKNEPSLSNVEAGRLLSICLHALVAAAPLVSDSRQLYDMSRIRSHGLSLAGSGAVARQPTELCLQYEDIFTDDMALRLAKRLFTAITTRRYFDELRQSNIDGEEHQEQDVLAPLFSQLDFLNMDAVYVLDFSFPDRALHETRVPILLLDWARAVMLNEWDGSPEVAGDGPFGGTLALIEAMYKRRHELLLADAQFRFDYLAERLDTIKVPISWLSHTPTRQRLHLLDFPYLFSPSTLVSYFRAINLSRMGRYYEEASSLHSKIKLISHQGGLTQHHKDELTERMKVAGANYLVLDISRDAVLQDAFDQLWRREERELLRPLKVRLGESSGEEGFDSGGVQQEFFRMAIAEALNPDYGAFTVDERTRMAWFLPGSLEDEWKFELIGLLVSLAVYNGLTLPVTFPKALYRKLLGEPVTELHHIADGWPDLASGLTSLLEWDEKDGLVEDVFARTYEFSVSTFGQVVTREMKPLSDDHHRRRSHQQDEAWPQFSKTRSGSPAPPRGNPDGDDAPLVTSANRNAYVSDYIRYLTDVSVRPQYEAFARGFHTCLHPKSLTLLTPSLLQSVVEGVQEIDIAELKRYVRYIGWDASHRTVRDFWSIVKRYDDNMKRKLLEFVTASDRLPVGGPKNLMFIVQRNGEEDDPAGRLPTSYTCYGTLLLPEYKDKEVLRERLAMALENAQGFGFA